jgi:hypothetical protein
MGMATRLPHYPGYTQHIGITGPLEVEILPNGRSVRLKHPFVVAIDDKMISVPSGFVTDFASVPRLFWRLLPPWGPYSPAALVHDKLYQKGKIGQRVIDRFEADWIFLELLCDLKVASWQRALLYAGVRVGGWVAWNRYRRADKC